MDGFLDDHLLVDWNLNRYWIRFGYMNRLVYWVWVRFGNLNWIGYGVWFGHRNGFEDRYWMVFNYWYRNSHWFGNWNWYWLGDRHWFRYRDDLLYRLVDWNLYGNVDRMWDGNNLWDGDNLGDVDHFWNWHRLGNVDRLVDNFYDGRFISMSSISRGRDFLGEKGAKKH